MAAYLKFLKHTLSHTRWYLLTFAFFLILGAFSVLFYGNYTAFILSNSLNLTLLNWPIMWLTELSSGLILSSIFVLLCAKKYPKETLLIVVITFIAWYSSTAIKYTCFQSWRSPSIVFGSGRTNTFAPELQPELNLPSSHATIISALFFAVTVLFSLKRSLSVLCALFGIILMCTRIYVGWSYLVDILVGSIIGIISILLFLDMCRHFIYKWYDGRTDWGQRLTIVCLRTLPYPPFLST